MGAKRQFDRRSLIERWLREEVLPGHVAYDADSSKGVPADQILARIKARRRA